MNVHAAERAVSVLAGVWLVGRMLRSPSLGRAPAALAGGALLFRGVTGHCHTYAALGIDTTSAREALEAPLELQRSVTIGKPASELYRLWQEPRTLARVMGGFADVQPASDGRTIWRVHGPLEQTLEYTTRIVEEVEGERLRWESEPGQGPQLHGSLQFRPAPGDYGTEVTLRLVLQAPRAAKALAKLLGPAPKLLVQKALRRFKSLAETGEIPTLHGNPAARAGGKEA